MIILLMYKMVGCKINPRRFESMTVSNIQIERPYCMNERKAFLCLRENPDFLHPVYFPSRITKVLPRNRFVTMISSVRWHETLSLIIDKTV